MSGHDPHAATSSEREPSEMVGVPTSERPTAQTGAETVTPSRSDSTAANRSGVGRRMDSRDVTEARERFEEALQVYANALAWWNAPDHLHSRTQIRSMVEAVLEDELPV